MKTLLKLSLCLIFIVPMVFSATFVGSESCKLCHNGTNANLGYNIYEEWENSGHPYKFSLTADAAPTYPSFVTNFQADWLTGLGNGTTVDWTNIAGVIGGFGWKARFVDENGVIAGTASSNVVSGLGHNQFNFFGGENYGWVDYSATTVDKKYNYGCFKCHTTGGDTTGSWIEGKDLGTFTEGGVGCEGCHGPGSDHAAAPTTANIDKVYEFAHMDNDLGGLEYPDGTIKTPDVSGDDVNFLCGTCHNRSYTSPINSSGGFIKHHEQWDMFVSSPHSSMSCTTCHDPHKRVIWDGDGIKMQCGTCHADPVATTNHLGTATCIDCHMPYAAKSGTTRGESGYVGDVRTHIFDITVNDESMFSEDGSVVRDDETRDASLSPAYSCLGCHNNDSTDDIPEMTLEQAVNIAKNMHTTPTEDPVFVGSETCKACHDNVNANMGYNIYEEWFNSGHPYKFSKTDTTAPVYPDFVTNFQDTWLTGLGNGTTVDWTNISGVIGGFGWKARFVDENGVIAGTASSDVMTGAGHNQFNFFGGVEHGWVDYSATTENKKYNYSCFKCHTTGGDTTGSWIEGKDLGTFTEGGVGCEACHGPGSNHVQTGDVAFIDKVYEFAHMDNASGGLEYPDGTVKTPDVNGDDVTFLCGTCHNRDYASPINSSSGYIKHHEQWDMMVNSLHSGLTCTTCHDPHKRVIWDGDGITKTCGSCHTDEAASMTHSTDATCIDCHMPYAAKSGTTRGSSGFRGDVRSHLFTITADTSSMFTEDGANVRADGNGKMSLNPQFACLGCHNDDASDSAPDQTIDAVMADIGTIHGVTGVSNVELPEAFNLRQNYPNPFNPTTTIEFEIPENSFVTLTVFSITGQKIATLVNRDMKPGNYKAHFNAFNISSGVYFYKIEADNFSEMKKMIVVK